MMKLTKAQRRALYNLYLRNSDGAASYREFRKRVFPLLGDPSCAMIPWLGMYIGIESDGHTHS